MDSAWSSGRAPPALIQAIMAQKNPSTRKCSPEVLGQRRCRGGFPWAQVSVLQEPGHSSRCAGSAEPRAGNHPCLASCLWKELPQSAGKSLHTLACVYTRARVSTCCCGLCKPLENLGSCWAAKMHVTSQKPRQQNSLLPQKWSWASYLCQQGFFSIRRRFVHQPNARALLGMFWVVGSLKFL